MAVGKGPVEVDDELDEDDVTVPLRVELPVAAGAAVPFALVALRPELAALETDPLLAEDAAAGAADD